MILDEELVDFIQSTVGVKKTYTWGQVYNLLSDFVDEVSDQNETK
jgi:hypothetical protein